MAKNARVHTSEGDLWRNLAIRTPEGDLCTVNGDITGKPLPKTVTFPIPQTVT
jgi:hypothetical protein